MINPNQSEMLQRIEGDPSKTSWSPISSQAVEESLAANSGRGFIVDIDDAWYILRMGNGPRAQKGDFLLRTKRTNLREVVPSWIDYTHMVEINTTVELAETTTLSE